MASFVEASGHAGDEGNFEALYETYKSDVQRLASYLLKNATDAEDAAQTVFLNVLRALRQGVTPTDPRAWLLSITRNVCFSRHRAAAARPAYVELDVETAADPSGDEAPTADEIVGALARLLPNQRTALILRDFRGAARSEICELMTVSPTALEALLTRARVAFREELEAGDQPLACAETRALVERQLDGLITVAHRHSLRSHLRHCGPCATLARAVRSTRGKLAGLIFWPVDLVSRLVAALSQAPAVAHVAAALGTTAAVATVAIPVAVTTSSGSSHVEGRTAAGRPVPAIVHSTPAPAVARATTMQPVSRVVHHAAAQKPATHVRPSRVHSSTVRSARPSAPAAATSTPVAATGSRPATPSGSALQTPSSPTTASSADGISTVLQQAGAGAPVRSTSPAVKPAIKPRAGSKSKPARKSSKKRARGRHAPAPHEQMPPSSPPAADLPVDTGAPQTAGPGISTAASVSRVVTPPPASSAQGSSPNSNDSASGSGSAGKDRNRDKHKK